ncbi:MAG: nucleoside 2-deoxyribosyltransferase [Bryobacteraceae bacterium]|jgi:hypothetical protein
MKPNGNSPVSDECSSSTRWAPILGHWSVGDDQIAYKGGDQHFAAHGQEFPIGILVNNRELLSGACRVDVEFDEVSSGIFAGGIILGYRSQERYYLEVQLGAGQAAYCVSEFVSGFGWRPLKVAGPRDVLEAKRRYTLDVSLRGQELRAAVDGVKVLEILIPRPLEGKQTGLTAAGSHPVRFSNFAAAADRPRAFVAMEYREPFDTFYREVIKPQAEKLYEVVRIDEKSGPGVIFQDMQREISQSDVVIAEITPANPNVFYELGYAQALGKPTILLAQRGGKLPFDIASYRVVFYDDSIGGKSRVEEDLARHLDAISQSAG